jgi:LacI family transcriptional regulator
VDSTPSLRDIAVRTGVTIMSVSRALRGSPQVSAAKRDEILRVAKELGYRPDPQVTRLMALLRTSKAKRADSVIALINTRAERGLHLREPHLREFYEGAAQRADELGFKLEEFWLADPAISVRRQQSILNARGIEALLLLPVEAGFKGLPLDVSRFALSAIGRSHHTVPCDRACPNHYNAVTLALARLAERGFHRVGAAFFDGINERTDRRYSAAVLDHLDQLAPADRVPPLISPRWDADAFRAWFETHRPGVVVTHGEHIREFALRDLGLRAPRDYGYVNLNLLQSSDRSAGIDQNYALVGAAALDLLAGQVNHQERGLPAFPRTVTINGVWREGDSLPARSRARAPTRRSRPRHVS